MSELIVIVDASRLMCKIVEVCLRREGIACVSFFDGSTALHALQGNPQLLPSAIFVEVTPPGGIDGYSFIRLLRASHRFDHTAVVVFTDRNGFVNRLRARAAGANRYLLKPFNRREFLTVVAACCERGTQQHATGDCHEQTSRCESLLVATGVTRDSHISESYASHSGR